MNTTTLQITFTNKDKTEMTKEAFFAKVDRARKGKMIHMSREEMKKLIKNN
ncbi:hypothetical protein [Capnocytophaga granulosa]|uniref:hypothetical protein n=1 Tax=Capnocytophaga granulosa TaxID=45242 RepID=UPI0023F399AC|nr:hypothetical protein [Capnocytophaga granulosa]